MSAAFLQRLAVRCGRCPGQIVFATTDAGRSMPAGTLRRLAADADRQSRAAGERR
jgi:hypothetical protein